MCLSEPNPSLLQPALYFIVFKVVCIHVEFCALFVCLILFSFVLCCVCLCPHVCNLLLLFVTELDLTLKKDALSSSDGSSLEALLKAEPLDKRAALELRGPEDDPSGSEYSTGSLNTSTRVRKVPEISRTNIVL